MTQIKTQMTADQSAVIRVVISGHPRLTGQAIVEYAILIGIVTAAIVGMQVYAKRGLQAGIKLAADQLGDQREGVKEIDLNLEWKEKGDATITTVVSGSQPTTPATKTVVSEPDGKRIHTVDEQTTSHGLLSRSIGGERGQ